MTFAVEPGWGHARPDVAPYWATPCGIMLYGVSQPLLGATTAMKIITVSPSTFGFLYDECKACFYLEAHGLWRRPRTPFPAIFTAIDAAMKRHYEPGRAHQISGLSTPFRLYRQGAWVQSRQLVTGADVAL